MWGNRGSRRDLFVAFDEHLEEVGSVVLVTSCGVVALCLEDGVERLVGGG
jgi:hypothetical protein